MITISDILEINNKVQAITVFGISTEYLNLVGIFSEKVANTLPNYSP